MNTIPHPGHYIKEWLQNNRRSQAELAVALNFQEPFISKIVNGKAHVSPPIAIKLEAVTQIPATIWMKYETDFALARARQQVQ
jgi:HTH-type transcriptional regulator/antitoxin HigA